MIVDLVNKTVNIHMSDKSIYCFTHHDLDGAATYLVTKWAHPGYKISVNASAGGDATRKEVTKWLLHNEFTDYEKVFFLDMDVSDITDLIDQENVVIIDHHQSHVEAMDYKNAISLVKEYPSACLLAYKIFRKLYDTEFTEDQKKLIIYANDYDSYANELPESKILNIIFWNTQSSFKSFTTTYAHGFRAFTKQQKAIFKIFVNELQQMINDIEIYQGVYDDDENDPIVVIAAFANKHINDIAEYLLDEYVTDAVMIINMKSKHVSFRRPEGGTAKLNIMADKLADGGGHEYSAGGSITAGVLEFTKNLKPI